MYLIHMRGVLIVCHILQMRKLFSENPQKLRMRRQSTSARSHAGFMSRMLMQVIFRMKAFFLFYFKGLSMWFYEMCLFLVAHRNRAISFPPWALWKAISETVAYSNHPSSSIDTTCRFFFGSSNRKFYLHYFSYSALYQLPNAFDKTVLWPCANIAAAWLRLISCSDLCTIWKRQNILNCICEIWSVYGFY